MVCYALPRTIPLCVHNELTPTVHCSCPTCISLLFFQKRAIIEAKDQLEGKEEEREELEAELIMSGSEETDSKAAEPNNSSQQAAVQ